MLLFISISFSLLFTVIYAQSHRQMYIGGNKKSDIFKKTLRIIWYSKGIVSPVGTNTK